jgi:prepilin peptidase CpaA
MTALIFALFAGLLIAASAHDLRHLRIPNWIPLALVALFALRVILIGGVPILPHLSAAAAVLGMGFLLFGLGLLGAGDGKLLAAVALWTAPEHMVTLLLLMAVLGGVLALVLTLRRRFGRQRRLPLREMRTLPIPYGVAIAAAGLLVAGHDLFGG